MLLLAACGTGPPRWLASGDAVTAGEVLPLPGALDGWVLQDEWSATLRITVGADTHRRVPGANGASLVPDLQGCEERRLLLTWQVRSDEITLTAALLGPDDAVRTSAEGLGGTISTDGCSAPGFANPDGEQQSYSSNQADVVVTVQEYRR
ncbi:hypothetical protein GCM10011381_05840 [Klenkia taihuensis]|nr:hypothetical protein GCM10011381_05840 [Klenkia taihuensis]